MCFVAVLLAGFAACNDKPAPTAPAAPKEDPKIAAIKADVAKTTPQEKATIDKCLAMKPEVNGLVAAKTLGDIVNDFATTKGDYNIRVIGWEAHAKSNKRWKLILHYQDYQKQLVVAEWEYNPETNKVYPFDLKNAPIFYTSIGADANANKKAK